MTQEKERDLLNKLADPEIKSLQETIWATKDSVYIDAERGKQVVTLDGDFTLSELKALMEFMS